MSLLSNLKDALAQAGIFAAGIDEISAAIAALSTGGAGTVNTVSVVTANGVSGSVANPTTAPAITLALGAITPTTVVASGAVFGANLSGTNTGDQTLPIDSSITTTDVTGNNVSTSKHGWAPKAPNDVTKFLNGLGAWSVPTFALALGFGVPLATYGTLANDGVTDDSAVFIAAVAAGARSINARGLNCAILAQVNLAANQHWDCKGSNFTTTGSTITTFKADTIDDWSMTGPFTITGAGSTVGSAKGIHTVGCNRYEITDYRAKNIKGHGLYVAGAASGTLRGDQGRITGMTLESCYWGWEDVAGATAEYTIVTNFNVIGCTTWGIKTCAGNISWSSGNVVDNPGWGVMMVAGGNHAHGMFSTVNVNHNVTGNFNAAAIILGQTLTNCHMYEGTITLDGCKGIIFLGGEIDTATITVNSGTGSGRCRMSGVNFLNTYGNPTAIAGSDPLSLVTKDCDGPGSPGNNDIALVSKSADATYGMEDEGFLHPAADTTARTFTVPLNAAVPVRLGKVFSGVNQHGAGVISLACAGTMRLAGAGTTGTRAVAADGSWAIENIGVDNWIVTGVGVT